MTTASLSQSKPIPSATCIVLRDNHGLEVLLLQRNKRIKFHGGAWVFPGGKVDSLDHVQPKRPLTEHSPEQQHEIYRRAAVREAQEEAGLLLNINDLRLCSTWLTPENMKKRFNAWFFVCVIKDQLIRIDDSEIKDYQWIKPHTALEQHQGGDLALPPPTYVSLHHLAKFASASKAYITMSATPCHFKPKLMQSGAGLVSLYQEDAAYDKELPDTPGPRHRLLMHENVLHYEQNY